MLVSGLLAVAPPPASAAVGCKLTDTFHVFDGYDTAANITGAQGTIDFRALHPCGDSTSASSDWVMVTPATPDEYAQAGYFRDKNLSDAEWFTEYNDGTGHDGGTMSTAHWFRRILFCNCAEGNADQFRVQQTPNNTALQMIINNTVYDTTPWNPHTAWGTDAWEAQYLGEVWDPGDDMPGMSTAKAGFRTLRTLSGGSWSQPTIYSMNEDSGNYHQELVLTSTGSIQGFNIWTARPAAPSTGPVPIKI
jgi:hypothetical protein